ncbi:hypothetical protein V6N13_059213 [Hibiscus sabdariffa]
MVNYEKSLIYFSENVVVEEKTQIAQLLGVRISSNPESRIVFWLILKARYYPRSDFMFAELGPGVGRVRRDSMDIRHTMVSDLIDSGDQIWKHYIVSELFEEEQTSRICSIPLSKIGRPD